MAMLPILCFGPMILAVVSSNVVESEALLNLPTAIAAGVAAVVLFVVTVVLKNNVVGLVASLGAIACNMTVLNFCVSERILTIAGIFSYNSGNQDGWTVFYFVVASAVCTVLSCVAAMVANFNEKESKILSRDFSGIVPWILLIF